MNKIALFLSLLAVTFSFSVDAQEVFVEERLLDMTLAGSTLLWFDSCGDDFSGLSAFVHAKETSAAAASPFRRLLVEELCGPFRMGSNIVADATYVYWIGGDGGVYRLPRAGAFERPTRIGEFGRRTGSYPGNVWLAIGDGFLFWADGADIFRLSLTRSGFPPERIYDGMTDIRRLRFVGGRLYGLTESRLVQYNGTTSLVARLVASNVTAYAVNDTRVAWGERALDRFHIRQQAHDLSGSAALVLTSPAGGGIVEEMTADTANIYYYSRRHPARGRVWRVPFAGGSASSLTPDILIGMTLVTDGTWLFYQDYFNIYRVATGAPPVPPASGDALITGIEVTQGIQVPGNTVPLIASKLTGVRVYARGIADVNGPWTGVQATLTVDGAGERSSRAITLSETGSNRSTLDDSFLFVLRPEETAGTRRLTVRLQPPLGRPEVDVTNNTREMTVTFNRRIDFWAYGSTYSNLNNGADCTGAAAPGVVASFTDEKRWFVENTFPVSTYTIEMLPGTGRGFENGDCLSGNLAMNWTADVLNRYRPGGGQRAHLINPEQGLSGWCCNGANGNLINIGPDDQPFDPGSNMGHEMTHAWVWDAHSDDMSGGYPHPGGGIGPQVGLRFQPTAQAMPGLNADGSVRLFNILSAPSPMWISPFTYCSLLNAMSGGSVTCDAATTTARLFRQPPVQVASLMQKVPPLSHGVPRQRMPRVILGGQPIPPQRFIYVAGNIENGLATFRPFEVLTLTVQPAQPQGTSYRIDLLRGTAVVRSLSFDLPPNMSRRGKPIRMPDGFGVFLPWSEDVTRITLSSGGKVLAERTVSAQKPKVTLTATPSEGTGKQVVSWKASDADGDKLTYSVWYQAQKEWIPIDVGVTDTSLTVDFDRLAGSDASRIRVLASDGVNTTETVSKPFRVPRKNPKITISGPKDVTAGIATVFRAHAVGASNDNIVWTDNGELLGKGPWVVPTLKAGDHLITAEVVDADGMTGTASMKVPVKGSIKK